MSRQPTNRTSSRLPALACVAALSVSLTSAAPIRFADQDAELTISEVSERTVRIQLAPLDDRGQPRAATPSTVLAPFAATEKLRVRRLEGERQLTAGKLRVNVEPQPLSITIVLDDGKPVQQLVFDEAGGTNAGMVFRTTAPVLGLGEGAQQYDRRGAFYPMEPGWGAWNRPVLGSVVPSPLIIGTEGWAMFAHRPEGQFDLRESKARFIPIPRPIATNSAALAAHNYSLDLFVVGIAEPADALTEYTRLTGKPVMPPKWALGYFQSHRTLAGPAEPLTIASTFRERQLPCDALIYLGTGYCTNGWNVGHGTLDFNTNAFLAENLKQLHDLNFRVILHINAAPQFLFGKSIGPPYAQPATPITGTELRGRYLSQAQRRGLGRPDPAQDDVNSPLHIRNYWAWHRPVFALGVDGWWPDDGDELPLEARLTRHRTYYEGPLLDRPNVRPWSLHRTGYAGSQRYGGWIWSGDIDGKWGTLQAQVSVGLNHGLSLTPFWGTDTGGFYPSQELTGELYTRWFQFSTFCASFRSHGRTWKLRLPWGWNTGEFGPKEHPERQHPDPSELHNAEVEPIAKKFLELRYRLLPYNYTVAREASDTGLPMMRALWLHYPDDAEAVKLGYEYLWGRDMLVAPVIEKGAKSRRVYLPAGSWLDWWTGEVSPRKRWIERPVDLATLPLYVRAGAIIPLDPVRQFTGQSVNEPTTLRVHPGSNGSFTLYDDDGESLGYRDGADPKTIWVRMNWNDASRRLTLEPDPRMKQWSSGTRIFNVEVAGATGPLKRIEFRGGQVSVTL